jgi:hypothetical protein
MARFDKVEPYVGNTRARLAADWVAADGVPIGVGLDATGKVVVGAGTTGIVGIVVLVKENKKAGDTVDIMTAGDIVECPSVAAAFAAGTIITANTTTGVLSVTVPSATQAYVGFTVEAGRLVVRQIGRNL